MGHFLHFGAGPNQLAAPWQNLTVEHDIRKPLRFPDGSASRICAEHVIEHVAFSDGVRFLQECRRVLEPGGTLRIGFPDVGRFLRFPGVTDDQPGTFELSDFADDYARALAERGVHAAARTPDGVGRAALALMLLGWHHCSAWTTELAAGVLLVLGFRNVRAYNYGGGELGACDGHAKDVGDVVATLESTYFEARK